MRKYVDVILEEVCLLLGHNCADCMPHGESDEASCSPAYVLSAEKLNESEVMIKSDLFYEAVTEAPFDERKYRLLDELRRKYPFELIMEFDTENLDMFIKVRLLPYEYGGLHFIPYCQFSDIEYSVKEVSSFLKSDRALGFSNFLCDCDVYSHESFYAAMNGSNMDVFYCMETDRYYLPGENELFLYSGPEVVEKGAEAQNHRLLVTFLEGTPGNCTIEIGDACGTQIFCGTYAELLKTKNYQQWKSLTVLSWDGSKMANTISVNINL